MLSLLFALSGGFAFAKDPGGNPGGSPGSEPRQACRAQILGKLKNPGMLNVGIALGYSDTLDEGLDLVTDGFLRDELFLRLTGTCESASQMLCGFGLLSDTSKVREDEVDFYSKDLVLADGGKLTFNIQILHSSVTVRNSDNQAQCQARQSERTAKVRDFYGWALRNLDAVFYEGHSRDGGGPDFAPPRANSKGTVDYPWYRKNQPGFKFLLENLDGAQPKPMIVGLFSCASRAHFIKTLQAHSPQSHFITTPIVLEAGKTKRALFHTIESLLNFECDAELQGRLKAFSFFLD
jgi:hypothetical protein